MPKLKRASSKETADLSLGKLVNIHTENIPITLGEVQPWACSVGHHASSSYILCPKVVEQKRSSWATLTLGHLEERQCSLGCIKPAPYSLLCRDDLVSLLLLWQNTLIRSHSREKGMCFSYNSRLQSHHCWEVEAGAWNPTVKSREKWMCGCSVACCDQLDFSTHMQQVRTLLVEWGHPQ